MSSTDAGIKPNEIQANEIQANAIKEVVKEKYGQAALRVKSGGKLASPLPRSAHSSLVSPLARTLISLPPSTKCRATSERKGSKTSSAIPVSKSKPTRWS